MGDEVSEQLGDGDTQFFLSFRELLPASCPPQPVNHPTQATLWRLLSKAYVEESDFDSQFEKFKDRKFPDVCAAKGVSLMTSFTVCQAAAKSPRLKRAGFTHAVEVDCCTTRGVWHQDSSSHVNWWPFASVDVLKFVGAPWVL